MDAAAPLPANTQVALSSYFARHDVAAAILPRLIVFEIGTADLTSGTEAFVRNAERLAEQQHAPAPRVIFFEGKHETDPEATLPLLREMIAN
jgi:hypothetical protein